MLLSSIPQPVKPDFAIDVRVYLDIGWHVIPVSRNKIPLIKGWTERQPELDEFPAGCRISQVTGPQLDGSFIIGPEFDHRPEDGIDATANYQAFLAKISERLFHKLHITRSTSGTGYHIRAQVPRPVAATIIRNDAGKKIGDLRSTGGHLIIQDPDKWLVGAPWTMETLTGAELDELLQALNYQAPVTPATSTLDWSAAKAIHVPSLLTDGIPSRFRPTCQGAHYLRQEIPVRHTSDIRYALIEELIRCEYSDEQAAALALHLADFGASERKGVTWLENDIDRIIRKVRAAGPKTSRRRVTQRQIEVDDTGRALHKHEAPYLFWYDTQQTGGKVIMSRPERAASFGVSVRTLDRVESHLISIGKIRRGLSANRQIAWVERVEEYHEENPRGNDGHYHGVQESELRCCTNDTVGIGETAKDQPEGNGTNRANTGTEGNSRTGSGAGTLPVSSRSGRLEQGSGRLPSERPALEPAPVGTAKTCDTHIDQEVSTDVSLGGVWGGGSTEEAAAPILAHVVEDAIEALGESRVRKRRADIILGIVRAYIPDADPEQVAWLAKHAVDWRRQRRADDALRTKLAAMTLAQLKSKLRGLSGKAADLHKQGKPRQAWVFSRLAWFVQKELDKPERQAEQARLGRKKAIQQVLGGVV